MKIWRFSSFFDKESFVVEYVPLKIEIAYFFSEGGILYSERKEKQSDLLGRCGDVLLSEGIPAWHPTDASG